MDQAKDSDHDKADQNPTSTEATEQPAQAEASSSEPPKDVSEQTKEAFNKPSELDAPLPDGADKPLSNTSDIADLPKKGAGGQRSNFKIGDITHNIYVIIFIVIFIAGAGFTGYSIMGSKKKPPLATIGNTALSQTALNQLAASNSDLGGATETLTVQSNAVFAGQLLARGNLTVAGSLQTGGGIQTPSIVVSNTANLGDVQAKSLQIAGDETVQGAANLTTLTVNGASTFSGPITASVISVSKLILSNGGSLQVPNHISFPGPAPAKTSNQSALGNAGSASVNGSDTSGTVNINTGNNPTTGCFVQVTFNQAYTAAPRILITPVSPGGAALQYYASVTPTTFSICSASTPASGTVDTFDYFIMGQS